MAGILPLSGTQQFDNATGAFLNGGKLYIYDPGTTTPAAIYSDLGLTPGNELPSPILLNSVGRIPPVYAANGSIRVRLRNSADVIQFDDDPVPLVTPAAGSSAPTPIPDSTQIFGTRDLKIRFDDQPLDGYVRLNGRTIGSATSGAAERANADVETLFKELWTFANVSVVTGKGANAAADWSANKKLTLPNMSGRLLGAMDDLGGGAAGNITATTVTGPTLAGATGGAETVTVAQGNLPNVSFTNSGIALADTTAYTFGYSAGAHTAGATTDVVSIVNSGGGATITPVKSGAVSVSAQGSAASGGSGTAVNKMPPVMLFMIYIKI